MGAAFSTRERRILGAFAEALLPGDVGVALAPESVDLVRHVEQFVVRIGPGAVLGVGALLTLFDLAVPLVSGRFRRMVSLPLEERIRYLHDWDESRFYLRRATLLGLKSVVTMVYCGLPEVQRAIGYQPGNIVNGALADQATP